MDHTNVIGVSPLFETELHMYVIVRTTFLVLGELEVAPHEQVECVRNMFVRPSLIVCSMLQFSANL